jgi:hypothetical protein
VQRVRAVGPAGRGQTEGGSSERLAQVESRFQLMIEEWATEVASIGLMVVPVETTQSVGS